MNDDLQEYARTQLKEGLAKLPHTHHRLFKRMYSHTDLDKNIDDVVDDMPADKLDWAMQQVQNSLYKENKSVD